MKKENYGFKVFKIIWNILIFSMLLIVIAQFNNIQKRLINIETKGISNNIITQKTNSQNNTNYGVSNNRTWLNPELPNLILNEPIYLPPENSNYNTKIVSSIPAEEKTYNPLIASSAGVTELYSYIGCALADRDWKDINTWKGILAERAESLDDGKTYIIYLKKNIKWHKPAVDLNDSKFAWLAGDHFVTTKDIKFAIDTLMNHQVEAGSLRNYFQDVESVEAIDDYTLIIKWKTKQFRNQELSLSFPIIPEFIYAYDESGKRFPKETFGLNFNNHWYNDRMIGCGPYVFKEHLNGIHVLLERNENYALEPKPVPKEIKFLIVKDENLAYLKLKSGEISIIDVLSKNIYRDDILNGNAGSPFISGNLKYIKYPTTGYGYIGWNNIHPIFKDKMVRRAMTHAFDSDRILSNVWAGLGQSIIGPISPMFPEYDHDIKPYEYNLDKAKEILKNAGWADSNGDGVLDKTINGKLKNFEFSIDMFDYPPFKTMYAIYKEDLIKIGVKMNINILDWAVFQKKIEDKDFEAVNGGWSTPLVVDFYQTWHSSQIDIPGGSNYISFKNQEADELIVKLRETFDENERIKIAYRIQEILYEEQPYTFRFSSDNVAAHQSNLKNIVTSITRPHIKYHMISQE